jgi:metal-responsive CopG/Arc/MetJ family transcriptional regulator
MKKAKVTITLSEDLLQELDKAVRRKQAEQVRSGLLVTSNRSQVVEELLVQSLRRR